MTARPRRECIPVTRTTTGPRTRRKGEGAALGRELLGARHDPSSRGTAAPRCLITASDEAERALSLARLGSWSLDLRTGVVTRSPGLCRLLAATDAELTSAAATDFGHDAGRARVRGDVDASLSPGAPCSADFRVARPSGTIVLHSRWEVVRTSIGEAVTVFGVTQDVTEQREVEARRSLAERMSCLATFAAGAAHQINNPLTAVMANIDLVAEEIRRTAAPERAHELGRMLGDAATCADRIARIVRGLRTFGRDDERPKTLVDVPTAASLAIRLAADRIGGRARIVKRFADDVPRVAAHEPALTYAMVQLLVNAADAMPDTGTPDGEIRITATRDPSGRAAIEIRDTGRGVAKEILGRVFVPFFTTKQAGKMGMGLSICHGIVTALGGELTVDGDLVTGTRFRMMLPALPASPSRLEPTSARVLIVDDEPAVGIALGRILRGHEVTVVTRAADARDRIVLGQRYDVILCDLMMPEMNGLEFHEAVSKIAPEVASRIHFVTGGATTPETEAFLSQHPDRWIAKPIDVALVRRVVEQMAASPRK